MTLMALGYEPSPASLRTAQCHAMRLCCHTLTIMQKKKSEHFATSGNLQSAECLVNAKLHMCDVAFQVKRHENGPQLRNVDGSAPGQQSQARGYGMAIARAFHHV